MNLVRLHLWFLRFGPFESAELPPNNLFIVRPRKTTLAPTSVAIICSTILFSSGCQKKTVATNPTFKSKPELRESTKPLQAADLVGYDGTRLRKSVDRVIDANEKHDHELEKMTESGPDQ